MAWWGLLIDLTIAVGLFNAYVRGTRRGLGRVIFDIAGLLLATGGALLSYQRLTPWLTRHSSIPRTIVPLITFAVIWLAVEGIYLAFIRLYGRPGQLNQRRGHDLAAGAVSGLSYLVMVGLAIIILVGLPIPTIKGALGASRISARLLASTDQLQRQVSRFINTDLNSTLNFLTVEPEQDTETIELGFSVANGRVRADLESQMLQQVNRERSSRGLGILTMNETARTVARSHSQDMFARGYFSHITPEGLDPFDRMRAGGVSFGAAGENLALAPTLSLAHSGLMNSPGHRANILDPHYRTLGIGIISGGRYGLMVTQNFTD